jgi:NAD(P)-dependent dehydrogenase (short-subunit alcohol dehydrogenase family)
MSDPASRRGACLVVGAGPGVGAAVARAFAREGLIACVTRRPRNAAELEPLVEELRAEGGDMIALIDRIETEIGPLEVVVFNIGANVWFPIVDTTTRVYTKVWEMAALSGFITGREAARVMSPRGRGTILFTGATASVRGRAEFSAFSGAKHALRALAQSMARELGPKGIHVAHVICDGSIDGSFSRQRMADVEARLAADTILKPEEIARNYVWLHRQGRSAWTFEMDLRPWSEPW